jgi:heme-degrading monooxygenase HmoA
MLRGWRLSHPITGMDTRVSSGFMICRVWRGWTTKDKADTYERIVRWEVIPGIEARRIPGFRSIDLVRRERDHDVEFMTLMWFDTLTQARHPTPAHHAAGPQRRSAVAAQRAGRRLP